MSLSYQCIGRHLASVLRVFFVTRVSTQLYDLYFNRDSASADLKIINDLIENGWTYEAASLRYILLKSCESLIPLFALASCIAVLSRYFHKSLLKFMIVDDAESASSAGALAGWLFIVICFQCGITSLPDEDRYWRLLRNLGLIVIVNLHSLFKPVSDRLQSLSASRSKTVHKHVRVLTVGILSLVLPAWFLIHLWSQKSINSWTMTVTVFGFEMIFRMSVSLVIYAMCMINSFCDVNWRGLEDQIYYLKASCGIISYLCGISLFFNGTWVLLFENSTVLRALSLCIHLYFNIWNQAWKGWNVYNKRRLASFKMSNLRDATKRELIEFEDVCSICFQVLDSAKVTGCNHYFHADCLTRWLCVRDTCPICCSGVVTSGPGAGAKSAALRTPGAAASTSGATSAITTMAALHSTPPQTRLPPATPTTSTSTSSSAGGSPAVDARRLSTASTASSASSMASMSRLLFPFGPSAATRAATKTLAASRSPPSSPPSPSSSSSSSASSSFSTSTGDPSASGGGGGGGLGGAVGSAGAPAGRLAGHKCCR